MSDDELALDTIGEHKTALFLLMSDTDSTFTFLAAMVFSQLFHTLIQKADDEYKGFLPIHVQCLLDEFANIGKIPDFERIIAVIRSRNISACPILQSKAQLESVYDKKADVIVDNCDSFLFLGGKSPKTLDEVSKLLGKETIDTMSDSKSRGSQQSDGSNIQQTGRELMTIDELAALKKDECILHITGLRPFKSIKFKTQKHPRYNLLKERFDVEEYLTNPYSSNDEEFIESDVTND